MRCTLPPPPPRDPWAQLGLAYVISDPHVATRSLPSPPALPNVSVSHRRTVTRSTGLTCPFAGRCEVNKIQRRHCPACRLQKCLDAGMKKDSELAPPNTSIHGPGLSALPLVPQRVRHTRRVGTSPTMLLFRPKPQRPLVRLTVRDPTILSLLLFPPGAAHHGHTPATQCGCQTHPSGPV